MPVNWLERQPGWCYFYPGRDCPGWSASGICERIGKPITDALTRALLEARPELAGQVHYSGGEPWCDGVNHTTRCEPGRETPGNPQPTAP